MCWLLQGLLETQPSMKYLRCLRIKQVHWTVPDLANHQLDQNSRWLKPTTTRIARLMQLSLSQTHKKLHYHNPRRPQILLNRIKEMVETWRWIFFHRITQQEYKTTLDKQMLGKNLRTPSLCYSEKIWQATVFFKTVK